MYKTLTTATLITLSAYSFAADNTATTSGNQDANNAADTTNNNNRSSWQKPTTPAIAEDKLTFIQAVKLGKIERIKTLLQQQKNIVDDKQGSHYTGLFFASGKGYLDIASVLIEHGADVNGKGAGGWTPLMVATLHNQLDNMQLLINNGANLELQNRDGKNALMYAAEQGHIDAIALLHKHGVQLDAGSHTSHSAGKTALMFATEKSRTTAMQQLLKLGANVDHPDQLGRSAVFYAAAFHDGVDLSLFKDHRANFNWQDKAGNNALHFIARKGKRETLQQLIDYGSQAQQANKQQQTPLEVAAIHGNTSNIQLLLTTASATTLKRAYFAAANSGLTKAVQILLAQSKLDINSQNQQGQTALFIAAALRHEKLIELLLEKKADIHLADHIGQDALMAASTAVPSKVSLVEKLLQAGANPNHKDKQGNTALHLYAKLAGNNISPDVATLLLTHGAKKDANNSAGKTPKQLVEEKHRRVTLTAHQQDMLMDILKLL